MSYALHKTSGRSCPDFGVLPFVEPNRRGRLQHAVRDRFYPEPFDVCCASRGDDQQAAGRAAAQQPSHQYHGRRRFNHRPVPRNDELPEDVASGAKLLFSGDFPAVDQRGGQWSHASQRGRCGALGAARGHRRLADVSAALPDLRARRLSECFRPGSDGWWPIQPGFGLSGRGIHDACATRNANSQPKRVPPCLRGKKAPSSESFSFQCFTADSPSPTNAEIPHSTLKSTRSLSCGCNHLQLPLP